jgi:putative salt-induced outer membrane protein YdiY
MRMWFNCLAGSCLALGMVSAVQAQPADGTAQFLPPGSPPAEGAAPPMPASEAPLPPVEPPPDAAWSGLLPSETWLHAVPFNPVTWDGSVELGINGSAGNSETFSLQFGGDVERETDRSIWAFDFKYAKTNANGVETQNFGVANLKYKRKFGDSPWSWYVRSSGQFDEFRSYDFLFSINTGLGYAFIDNDVTQLAGRIGAGTSRRFGGANEEWTPEANLGLDFEHQLTQRQKFTGVLDYYPSWTDLEDYRFVTDLGWELLLDAEANLSLKVSVIDIYDSTPEESKPNDINYAVLLLWKL